VAKGPSYTDVRAALRGQYAVLVAGLSERDPQGLTDCEGWTLEDLETHVAITARGLARMAARDVEGPPDGGGVNRWAEQLPALAGELDAMAKAERLALAPQVPLVEAALAGAAEDKVVEQRTGRHTLKDAAVFRLVEAVVHGLDAGIAPHPGALKIVVRELARALADRHPGKSVEVRIPPYAAVQCLEGPRHTRGTPPNVVEADPVAWVRVCAGRESWADLIRTGCITASGERSDLTSVFPLLS
jgi:uncharacterized protein (TIGR03083 family)